MHMILCESALRALNRVLCLQPPIYVAPDLEAEIAALVSVMLARTSHYHYVARA